MATLNADQSQAVDAWLDFMMNDEKFFVISGPAGTGKTFLMNYLSNEGMTLYQNIMQVMDEPARFDQIAFTATTNKAAEVLSVSINKPVQTIHSYIGLKIQNDYSSGKTFLIKSRNYQIRKDMVLFIDEASTIDEDLMDYIHKSFLNCKIVFVGDHAQMAPVNEELSQVFLQVKPENFYSLTTPVRNAESPALMALCQQLRDTVETGIFRPIEPVEGVIEYLAPDVMEFGVKSVFIDPDPSCRILCFTNERVNNYNTHIRQEVRRLPELLTVGEAVVVGDAYQRGQLFFSVEQELTISYVGPSKKIIIPGTEEFIAARQIGFNDQGEPDENGGPFYGALVADDKDHLQRAIKYLAQRAKKNKSWGEFYDFKEQFLDIRQKASSTVYKAQGSTYEHVFIDIGNIGTSHDASQVARMLYVAVSRAKSKVYLYGSLPGRYHNSQGVPLWIPENGPKQSPKMCSPSTVAA